MKKKEKLLRDMSGIDDAYVAEADPRIKRGGKKRLYRLGAIAACVAVFTVSLSLWLFIPFNVAPPDMSQYADSEYFEIIEKLNQVTYRPPADKNNFEKYVENFLDDFVMVKMESDAANEIADGIYEDPTTSGTGAEYVEVTDNQVQGVIEGDLFKRTKTRAFYLRDNTLTVYSIEGEDSRELGSYRVDPIFDEAGYFYYNRGEMYLSPDGNTVTLVFPYSINSKGAQVGVLSLDVSDPENITENGVISISGGYLSSRSIDGKILLISEFYVGYNLDFSDEASFVPQIKTEDEEFLIPVESIVSPETLTSPRYTVICELDQETLSLDGCSALLSYSNEVYVSNNSIYATRSYTHRETDTERVTSTSQRTDITRICFGGDGFEVIGSVTVNGYLKDQYSMDEYDGMLRAVTTTSLSKIKETIFNDGNAIAEFVDENGTGTNASLYIVDIETMQVISSVENFAPWGEIVQSARFDGETAYVCTSVQLSDPVFFFDLSDIHNIIWKDTGTIEGFSSSLVNFGNGFLLGIGRGNSWNSVKIEVYEESGDGVVSVCKYEVEQGTYSTDYKSYLIDRENGLVGLGIDFNSGGVSRYILLHFNGYDIYEIANVAQDDGYLGSYRAFIEDGYLYVFSRLNFTVTRIEK